jgi:polygalacturonase
MKPLTDLLHRRTQRKMKSVAAVILFMWLAICCSNALAEVAQGRVFNVRDHGATGDGKSLDTAAIQKALDACGDAGGGTVLLPAGTYLSRPLVIRTKTKLLIESGATLRATDDPADYKQAADDPKKFTPFLSGEDLEDVTIAGKGVIDGSGARWWVDAEAARQKKPGYTRPRPNLIVLTRVTNLVVRDITLQNSPKFHLVPTECDGVTVSGITILAPERSPNTDGIDPSMCRRVTITGCTIDCGDDNIAIKASKKVKGREFACEDILVTDCTFKHGHGMSIGSETVGGVRNVRVKNCTFENTDNGIRIKSDRGRGGRVENVLYEDIKMTNARGAILFSCYYPKVPLTDETKPVTDTTPHYSGIVVRNLSGTSTQGAGIIAGLPESPIEGVTLENVSIEAAKTGLEIRNARHVKLKDTKIEPKSGEPYVVLNSEVDGAAGAAK